jgi:hypothetical protein
MQKNNLARVLAVLILLTGCKDNASNTAMPTHKASSENSRPLNTQELLAQKLLKKSGIDCNVKQTFSDSKKLIVRCIGKGFYAIPIDGKSYGTAYSCIDASCKTSDEISLGNLEAEKFKSVKWAYNSYQDAMTSRPTFIARIKSENAVNFGFPYDGSQKGLLTLRKDPKHGYDAYFSVDQGQILCRSYDGCSISIRFDDNEVQNYSATGPSDLSTTTIFINNFDRFYAKLKNAKVVKIQVPFYQEGERVFEFKVDGFSANRFSGKSD